MIGLRWPGISLSFSIRLMFWHGGSGGRGLGGGGGSDHYLSRPQTAINKTETWPGWVIYSRNLIRDKSSCQHIDRNEDKQFISHLNKSFPVGFFFFFLIFTNVSPFSCSVCSPSFLSLSLALAYFAPKQKPEQQQDLPAEKRLLLWLGCPGKTVST